MKENLEITNDIKNKFDNHSETYILEQILIKKHKLKHSTAYLYLHNFKEKYGKRKS